MDKNFKSELKNIPSHPLLKSGDGEVSDWALFKMNEEQPITALEACYLLKFTHYFDMKLAYNNKGLLLPVQTLRGETVLLIDLEARAKKALYNRFKNLSIGLEKYHGLYTGTSVLEMYNREFPTK